MSWNYRIVRKKHPDGSYTFGMHEAYYRRRHDTHPYFITENPIPIDADSIKDMEWMLEEFAKAAEKEWLDYEDI